ncbi:ABC transporter substrate-binding protein [Allokutzneria albata]|uniref:NitT/TauT family transport system substrate-binding protein n=1 Tax=Allokutzneria albata TaxID=211114 RepID=A0A1G9WGM0_ALLAB|nr:ABC transporter substrate-binding protein [Allokutzneria albata]SDM83712.1 NitT/TauT family transport system substrate-binding protein [Allokutzneria albata]
MQLRRLVAVAVAAVLAVTTTACGLEKQPEGPPVVRIGVGGLPLLVYLPTTLAQRLGYYADEGLDVRLQEFQSGAKALQGLQAKEVDVVSGFYDHAIQMQAKRRPVKAFVNMLRYPSLVLAVSPKTSRRITSIADLKGARVGVTGPGSSTDFLLKYLLVRNGLRADDADAVAIGGDSSAVAAMESGRVDAAVMIDPAFSLVQKRFGADKVRVLSDTRTAAGVRAEFGVSTYPATVLYSGSEWVGGNAPVAGKLTRAIVRTLDWMRKHTAAEIAEKMPREYAGGDFETYVQAIAHAKDAFSQDGTIPINGAEAVSGILRQFEPEIARISVILEDTFTNEFVTRS